MKKEIKLSTGTLGIQIDDRKSNSQALVWECGTGSVIAFTTENGYRVANAGFHRLSDEAVTAINALGKGRFIEA